VTVYAAGGSQPGVPSLSWPGGAAASGLAVSALSGSGAVAVHNSSAFPVTVTLAADGYWLAGTPVAAGTFGPLAGEQVARVLVGGGQTVPVPVAGHGGVPGSGAGTVALAVTAVSAFGSGRLTVYPAGGRPPAGPGLSWARGTAASGLVVSALSSGGTLDLHNSAVFPVTVTLAADGYWLSGTPAAAGAFAPVNGGRLGRVLVGAGATATVPAAGHGDVPASDAAAVALTVSATGTLGAGNVTVYPADASRPGVPSLSWPAQQAVSGLVVSALSAGGAVAVHNSSARPVLVTLAAAGYWLSAARTVSDITAKPTTMTLTGGDIAAVSGDPGATQTVTLAAAAPVPAVGRVLVAPASAGAPNGLLGTVTAVSAGTGGAHVVTLTPATLDEAYSQFNVSTSQTLTDSDIVPAAATQASQTRSTSATSVSLMSHIEPAAPAAGTSGLGYDLTNTQFDCQGTGAGPTVAVTADLSDTSVDLSLDANPAAPNIHFLITSDPVFDLNLGFTGQVTCKLAGQSLLEVRIPVAATPPLVVDLYPVLTLTAGGQASVQFEWKPRAAVGFDEGPGIDSETHGFGSSSKVDISATAGADLFLGLDAEITLAGAIGVGGDLGPDLSVVYDAKKVCVTVTGELKADLTADADVFVKHWSFALASGVLATLQLWTNCGGASPSAQPLAMSANLPAGTVGQPYSGAVTATGGDPPYTFTVSDGSLPTGLSMDATGAISGTPQTSGSATFTVKATDSAATAVSGTYTMTINDSSGSGGSGGSGGTWTAAEAQVPAGATDPTLDGVSCTSTSQCVAVGYYGDASDVQQGLLLTEADGSWTAASAPVPPDAAQGAAHPFVDAVSCPSAGQCVAVGSYDDSSGNQQGLLLTEADGSWTAAKAPLPSGASSPSLVGVSCPSAGQCVAVGYTASGASVLLTDADGSWTAASAPPPASDSSLTTYDLYAVSCWSASHCLATGDEPYSSDGILLTDDGGSWTATLAPLPAGTSDPVLPAVSCSSATQCVAVGWTASGPSTGLLLTEAGGSWTAAIAPLPADHNGDIDEPETVSCSSASQCVAVSTYTDGTGHQQVMLLTDADGSWTAAESPQAVNTISCPAASQCTGLGVVGDTSGNIDILILTGG
jgi:hypothetical protein